ncbi:MAG TPA: energy transducer TonB [Hymenobacter sp.]|uniref:energy transducer TonB n=1 Tax=Hymenobacter sp. TaxID=1898978 RepID=UPI002D7E1D7A|nr:energy transducer TonB [Hymenobacter sp.]HET9505699.1 energy transducer TonB [Hymenobacter sp.]
MASYLFGCAALLGLSALRPVAAQQGPGPNLAAVVHPTQTSGPPLARATSAAPKAAAAPAAPAAPAPLFRPDSIFVNPQVLPQFTGGEPAFAAYLKKNLHYPAEALRQHASGKVMVSFVLGANGLVTYATVLRGPHKLLNEEALRLIWHMPAWQPARQHGQPVRVSCTIPVVFEE